MLTLLGIPGLPEIRPGDDIAALILAHGSLVDGDIVVVTSKIVSKAEGRFVPAAEREAAIEAETVRVVAERGPVRIVQNRLGIVAAAAGIDASNVPEGQVLLLPEDPDASARGIAEALREVAHVGVLVSDTLGRPWRLGQTDVAIGAAGVQLFEQPDRDADGRPLAVTLPCVGDELCAAAELVKPKDGHVPVAVVRGRADLVGDLGLPGARSIIRPLEDDLFRTGG
ncbi:coenzyme F420-0:L-glutamate ligase [Aeromicrobium choanae]|uniref:Coenzyme F420-0:L-glutamate ligase / coenzyme F420-1:gamma-L-glutamate ligase n=1 Tax=Aeromicrobium choanae TaxID=1736691 RepID=A0A1T4Z3B3_9ACTN|nr:coenzyme F420-0:L-glutamate ligase [Aeromicrobium choanae]SKB08520.1 coenzyme F420-0:L-glutamate ligase / coenzyme F420-1:gamma-L-glutamate ligase [Aeromicrobium choanae]